MYLEAAAGDSFGRAEECELHVGEPPLFGDVARGEKPGMGGHGKPVGTLQASQARPALRARTPLSLSRHLPTLWGVTLAEGAKG